MRLFTGICLLTLVTSLAVVENASAADASAADASTSDESASDVHVCVKVDVKKSMDDPPRAPDGSGEAAPEAAQPSAADSPAAESAPSSTPEVADEATPTVEVIAEEDRSVASPTGAEASKPYGSHAYPVAGPTETEPAPPLAARWTYAPEIAPEPAHPFPPASYLRRMAEHYVTHEQGFAAVREGCSETIVVEMYPLDKGWTVFARYSAHEQEEKIDRVYYDELPKLAQRIVLALLYNRPVDRTITRLNVLDADSVERVNTIGGSNHLSTQVGSSVKVALPGVHTARGANETATRKLRLLTPVNLQFGYRGAFRDWGIDAYMRVGIGVDEKAPRNNLLGGHIEHAADLALGLHLLWYLQPKKLSSWYLGTGGAFGLSWLTVVEPQVMPDGARDTSALVSGGLTLSAVVGYEFLRANRVRPLIQMELNLPAWVFDSENDVGGVEAWMPGASLMAGILF